MRTYKPRIKDYGYPLGATEELREALTSLGFIFPSPKISRGCQWGEVYFFDKNLELAKSLMDPDDKHFRIEISKRYFYLMPYNGELEVRWQFSVTSSR
jgi:hypothetical protein